MPTDAMIKINLPAFREMVISLMEGSFYYIPAKGDVSSIGACRPRIFFINGFLCF